MVRHSAFTLIELIFAIVIIAISILSLPMINGVIAKNTETGLAQEVIFAASTELNEITSLNWDVNSTDTNTYLARVAWGTDCDAVTKLRPGHISQEKHRRCTDNTEGPSTITNGSSTNLNDINTTSHSIFINPGGSASGYKNTYNSELQVSYATIDPTNYATHNNNIKRIAITITDSSNNVLTKLTTFSSNIGEVDYFKRSY